MMRKKGLIVVVVRYDQGKGEDEGRLKELETKR